MRETEIHNGLPDREIRQLIAHDIRAISEIDATNVMKHARYDKDNFWDYAIEDCKNIIEFHQKRLKTAELRKGLQMVLKMHGWEEFDISDESIQKDPGHDSSLSFIGTEAEHENFLQTLYEEK